MANLLAFILFVAFLLGADLVMRWRARRRVDPLEQSADAALKSVDLAAQRLTAAASIPPLPSPRDQDDTPVISLTERAMRRRGEYHLLRTAKKT